MQRGTEQRAQTPSPQLSSADGPLLGQDGQVLAGPQVDWHRTPQEQAELRDASQELINGGNQTRRPGASPSQSHTHGKKLGEGPQALQHYSSGLQPKSYLLSTHRNPIVFLSKNRKLGLGLDGDEI